MSNESTLPTVEQTDPRATSNALRLDDLTLQKHVSGYPDELKEPVLWLAWFIRTECHRDMDVFMGRLKPLKIETDKTNWSKILRGRWNQDADGNALSSPVVSLHKVLAAIKTMRDDHRVREMAGKVPFVKNTTSQMIWDYIDVRRAPDRINRFGVIVGATGSQKTASLKQFAAEHNHGLCVWMECPENGSLKEFFQCLSGKYGGSRQDSYEGCKRRVFDSVGGRNTILLDNAQELYKAKAGADQPVFGLLRRLQDERKCTIIFSITPEFHRQLQTQMVQGYFEQFEGRAGGRRKFLILPDYAPEEDVLAFARAFKLRDAEKHLDYLVKISREPGRIRILLDDLQDAKVLAEAEGKPLTIGMIKEVRGED